MKKKVVTYFAIVVLAIVNGLNYHLFVFPNQFAPAGLNGLCTMFQYVTHWNMGYLSLLINLPLAALIFFKVNKSLALRSMFYVLSFSLSLVLLEKIDLSVFAYSTANSTVVGPLVSGVIYSVIGTFLLKAGANAGGTDFISLLIFKKNPHFNFFTIVFILNAMVAGLSYFVYGYKIEPVLMSVLYSFTSSMLIDRANKADHSAVRFEIITEHPKEISQIIIDKMHHSATLLPGTGIYRGKEMSVLICVVNNTQKAAMVEFLREQKDTFSVCSQVMEVHGNFKRLDNHGNREKQLLDMGEGNGL